MDMPPTPKEQMDTALVEAWDAAEHCKTLMEANNGSMAAVWAASAQAWASIATAIAARLP